MCQSDYKLNFCTCENIKVIHNKNSRRYRKKLNLTTYIKGHLVWRLDRYVGESNSGMIGMMILPKYHFGDVLSSTFVIEQLNQGDCFDFDYEPKEGDALNISVDYSKWKQKIYRHDYMSFIFKKGVWIADYHDAFMVEVKELKTGKLELLE